MRRSTEPVLAGTVGMIYLISSQCRILPLTLILHSNLLVTPSTAPKYWR